MGYSVHVLHLIHSFGHGGAERQLSILAPAIARMGGAVTVAYHEKGPNFDNVQRCGVNLIQLPNRNNNDPRICMDIVDCINKSDANVVQTWLMQMDVMGGLAAHLRKRPHVLSERSSGPLYEAGGWKIGLRKLIGQRAQAIVANSMGGLDYWRMFSHEAELRVIHNALTPPKVDVPLDDFGLGTQPLIVAAGRLSYEKNISVVVDAIAMALRRLPEHHALIFGEGPEREKTQASIIATGLADRIHMGGYTNSLSWWLRHADVFISASFMEGHPNVVIEAAAMGCPLVLSDIPAHREFADAESALFADTIDVKTFAQALVDTVLNRDAAIARAQNARFLTEGLSIDRAAQQYIDLYNVVLKVPRS
ncbi:glycosyltransferase [Chromobacterium sp. Beijing]|uniref:glycosyltransferase n=1 Tax=Chromobacterium sp. Beijing TaxID=2735795 RepID=UPI002105CF5E|nr:glycosyltransferase [Chromobacterium sp. Beijing]UJB33577.1 glycosyltransferase [Chromobacterium sp. Beijing]